MTGKGKEQEQEGGGQVEENQEQKWKQGKLEFECRGSFLVSGPAGAAGHDAGPRLQLLPWPRDWAPLDQGQLR